MAFTIFSSNSAAVRRRRADSALWRAIDMIHVDAEERASNRSACRQTSRNTSLNRSSARAPSLTRRNSHRYTAVRCLTNRTCMASLSPVAMRSIRASSEEVCCAEPAIACAAGAANCGRINVLGMEIPLDHVPPCQSRTQVLVPTNFLRSGAEPANRCGVKGRFFWRRRASEKSRRTRGMSPAPTCFMVGTRDLRSPVRTLPDQCRGTVRSVPHCVAPYGRRERCHPCRHPFACAVAGWRCRPRRSRPVRSPHRRDVESMIPKSGYRFSEKICSTKNLERDDERR